MIHNYYIIANDGRCIYDYRNGSSESVNPSYDPNLVSGFVSALIQFSSEAFSGTLQTINLKSSLLAISNMKSTNGFLIGVAIADIYDNPHPIESVSQEILQEYVERYPTDSIKPLSRSDKKYFNKLVSNRIKSKLQDRSSLRMITGILATIPVYALASLLYFNAGSFWLSMLTFPAGLLLGSLCGYYMGSPKTAMITFTLITALLNYPMLIWINLLSNLGITKIVEFPEIFLAMALAIGFISGIVGGWISQRRFLYQAGYVEPYSKLYHLIRG